MFRVFVSGGVQAEQECSEKIIFFNFSTPVCKMWIIQEPNMLELWNKLDFEERKKQRVYTMFKIFSTYIWWINI